MGRVAEPVKLAASTPNRGIPVSLASMAVADWLRARGIVQPSSSWHIEIVLDVVDATPSQAWSATTDTRFHLHLYASEWCLFFCHGGRTSWVRVTDRPYMHGRDDFGFVSNMPRLQDIGTFLASLEDCHGIVFQRAHARITTTLAGAESNLSAWVRSV